MSPTQLHLVNHVLGAVVGLAFWYLIRRRFTRLVAECDDVHGWEKNLSCMVGALLGAWWFGPRSVHGWDSITVTHAAWGALIGALLAREIYRQASGVRISSVFVILPPLALAAGLARFGCLFNSEAEGLIGEESYWPWTIDLLHEHRMRHAPALDEAVAFWLLALVGWLALEQWPRAFRRWGYAAFIAVAALVHFSIWFLRLRPPDEFRFAGLAGVQWQMLALVVYALISLDRRRPNLASGGSAH